MRVRLVHSFSFDAAHYLPRVPPEHKCRRLHGHRYTIEVEIAGPVDPERGWLIDFADIRRAVEPLRRELDHRLLNDVDGLENPTAELLSGWLWRRLAAVLSGLHRVSVLETCTSRCDFYGPGEADEPAPRG